MHILLTGATGHTGRHFLSALLAEGHRVTAVQRTDTRALPGPDLGPDRLRWVRQDLAQGTKALPADYDAVIHAAAHAPPRADNATAHVAHNVIATRNLVEHAARRAGRRMIFLSSISVYGRVSAPVVDEATASHSPGSYGLSKLLGEQLLAETGDRLASVSLRLPGIVGTSAEGPWLSCALADLQAGRPVRLHSPECPFNNFIAIEDLCPFLGRLLSLLRPGHDVLTLAPGEPLPLRTALEHLADSAGLSARLIEQPAPRPAFTISPERAVKHYGYIPRSVRAALGRLGAAVRRHEAGALIAPLNL